MDFNSLKDQVSNLTLYDLKAGVRKVQNAVMNYTEMEAKVREATNNEPWGASSTLMQEIANATYSYQLLNEIMPMIYKRFTEKAAEEWRQIYKGLQLLEFLIKNGSERVIDDARSHLSLLKMLRQFHYIDQNGKDQGVNVRNRAKELAELLSDVDRIRAERKKARANRNKFGGVEGGMGMSGGMSSGSRYGGFGSEDAGGYGGYSGGVYGDGGGFGGNTGGFQDSGNRRDRFEEYDEYDEGAATSSPRRKAEHPPAASTSRREAEKTPKSKPKAKDPEVDLFSFGDEDIASGGPALASPTNGKKTSGSGLDNGFGTQQTGGGDDDDFDDFQSATPTTQTSAKSSILGLPPPTATSNSTTTTTQFAAPKPVSGVQGANLNDLVGFSSISPAPSSSAPPPLQQQLPQQRQQQQQQQQQPLRPTGYQAPQPNYFTSIQVPSPQSQSQPQSQHPQSTTTTSNPSFPSTNALTSTTTATTKPSSSTSSARGGGGGDAFGSLWSTASATAGIKKVDGASTTHHGPNLASMAKEKASAGIWGAAATSQIQNTRSVQGQGQGQGQGLGLGMGMGMVPGQKSTPTPTQTLGGGLDDLLG